MALLMLMKGIRDGMDLLGNQLEHILKLQKTSQTPIFFL